MESIGINENQGSHPKAGEVLTHKGADSTKPNDAHALVN
jgi:hypothetical protein